MKVPIPWGADGPAAGWSERSSGPALERFQAVLLAWHRRRSRPLRIRSSRDPWAILVAEVMAQQTQIGRVDEAWPTFMARFPSPEALASVPAADVLRAWDGLGYNRRAVSLRLAAIRIVAEHDGRVPSDLASLERLPGVGPYTARAVAAVAFGRPVAAVDTNVRRVVGRLCGGRLSPAELQAAADALVPPAEAAAWTHATMDLGATICRPRPDCDACPVAAWCASAGRVEDPADRRAAGRGIPFEQTRRWLRGRIVAQLRGLPPGTWWPLPSSIGDHGWAAIGEAVAGLRRDGLVEQGPDGSLRLPSGRT